MTKTEVGTFTPRDGAKLYTRTWTPDQPSNIHLVFLHGFSDHINAYYDLFPTLSSSPYNITVHGFDQRGWGCSVSDKSSWGRTGDTHQVLCDIHDFIRHISNTVKSGLGSSKAKLFLMGHSMGGAESLYYILSDPWAFGPPLPIPISGVLVESPHIGFPAASAPNPLIVFSGRLLGKLLPNMQMLQPLDASFMCRDPKVCQDWKEDKLCHDTGTLRGLAGVVDRANYLSDFGAGTVKNQTGMREKLPCPMWFGHGSGDKICDFEHAKRLYERLLDNRKRDGMVDECRFVTYEGGYHKLHAEPDGMGEQFAKDVGDWVLQIIVGRTPSSALPTAGQASTQNATAGTQSIAALDTDNVKSRL